VTADLSPEERYAVSRISGLVLVNAMIFQEVLSGFTKRVKPLDDMLAKNNVQTAFIKHWEFIIEKINYYPIFHIAREILGNIATNKGIWDSLILLAQSAQQVVGMRAALRHDLMGRVYHRLLVEKKYLGTYYTSIPAATMLLKLSLRREAWDVKWYQLQSIGNMAIADLACGTGTLLMAAADALTDNYVSGSARHGRKVNTAALQRVLAEKVIYGYDVLASAIHLTASTIAMRAPEVPFAKMNLFNLPLGGVERRMGSIEYLIDQKVGMPNDLFGAQPVAEQIEGNAIKGLSVAPLPELDLCVMNPPFTRSVGGNLLFGSLPERERKKTQEELKKLIQRKKVSASITAGLGSVFVATADPYIKEGGRLALVLPKAFLSGVAWKRTRDLIQKNYQLEYLIASHDPERWNFSESTSLSEILLVAKKVNRSENKSDHRVVAINLWRNPTTIFNAKAIVQSVICEQPPGIEESQGVQDATVGVIKVGEALTYNWDELRRNSIWMLPFAFSQSDLVRVCYYLVQGMLWMPVNGVMARLPFCRLQELGELGPDRHGVHAGFKFSKQKTLYSALWGHDAVSIYTMSQRPNQYLSPRALRKKGQSAKVPLIKNLWPHSGRILICERLRLNTQKLTAALLSVPVLSNVWWPFSLKKELANEYMEKALTLWFNSTLGILLLLCHREETEGPWVGFKKTVLQELPVLDPRSLSKKQLQGLSQIYDRLCEEPLQGFACADTDSVREEMDKSIAKTLGLPDFSVLRTLLAREPIISLRQM
jgi:hypothetical protein